MASGRAYAHRRWNANAEGPAKKKSVIRVQCLPMARLLSVQSREEFGISRLRRQLFKEYTISYVLERRLIFGRLPLCVKPGNALIEHTISA